MDLGNIFSKVEGNADKLGGLLGGLGELKRIGGTDPLNSAMKIIDGLISDPHIPNIQSLGNLIKSSDVFRFGLMMAVGGWALHEVDLDPRLSRLGKALMNAGMGATFAGAAVDVIAEAGPLHSSSSMGGRGHSTGWGR